MMSRLGIWKLTFFTACTSFFPCPKVRDRFLASNFSWFPSLGILTPDLALRDDADQLLVLFAIGADHRATLGEAAARDRVSQVRRRPFDGHRLVAAMSGF